MCFQLGFVGEDALGTLLKKCPQTPSKLLGQRIDIQRVKFADQGEVRPLPRLQASGAAKTLPLRPHVSIANRGDNVSWKLTDKPQIEIQIVKKSLGTP